MKVIDSIHKLCMCCMEEHEVKLVELKEQNVFKGVKVEYLTRLEYCDASGETHATEVMVEQNDLAMKDAYRRRMRLLTYYELLNIRKKYDISQKDLSNLLGWGEKTITRYEGHQVQDMAHDAVLRKIDSDPAWFLELLERGKDKISQSAYQKCKQQITKAYADMQDDYLRKSILAQYVNYQDDCELTGDTKLDFDKIVDVVCYFANSLKVKNLFKVKLMKMLWYADFLSYKRYQHSITGLVYQSLPMGAVPIAHKSIIDLKGIAYEEIEYEDGCGYHFIESHRDSYPFLLQDDIDVLDTIIELFSAFSKKQIVESMHKENAYSKTPQGDIISYEYAKEISIN